eukprot:gene18348-21398_t
MKLLLFISLFLATIALPAPPRSKVLDSLHSGKWFKLICGASNQEVVTVRNLCLIYTVAGVDCIDVAADRAVVEADVEEKEGFNIDENENADDNGVDDDESEVTQIEIENHNSPSEIKSRLLA